jgi:hypothetical protein
MHALLGSVHAFVIIVRYDGSAPAVLGRLVAPNSLGHGSAVKRFP